MDINLWTPGLTRFGGGITAFSRELASAMLEQGHTLRLYGKLDAGQDWNGQIVRGCGDLPSRLQTPAFATRVMAGCFRSHPDWVVSTHLNFGPLARMARRLTGSSYALVAHGIDVHPALSSTRLLALREADRVVAVSQWTRCRVIELGGIREDRVVVLPNTYDEKRFTVAEKPHALAERYHLRKDEKVVLTVARLDAAEGYKGYDRILQALPEMSRFIGPVRFIIAGKGDDRFRLETMARDLGVADQVTFAGFVPEDELVDHYRLADVFAMPSTGEGFGIVFLEAMGCGTPVLGGNQDGSVDALHGGRLGLLVDPTSVDSIARGLISLLRKQGPEMWFDRARLSEAVEATYGRVAFQRRVSELFPIS